MPYGMMLDLAKKEVMETIKNIMDVNKIPPDMMSYIMDSVMAEMKEMKASYYASAVNRGTEGQEEAKE